MGRSMDVRTSLGWRRLHRRIHGHFEILVFVLEFGNALETQFFQGMHQVALGVRKQKTLLPYQLKADLDNLVGDARG